MRYFMKTSEIVNNKANRPPTNKGKTKMIPPEGNSQGQKLGMALNGI